VTVTGQHLAGTPDAIEARQDELAAVYHEHLDNGNHHSPGHAAGATDLTDEQIIVKASRCRNGRRFQALFFQGDISAYDGDDSRADDDLAHWFLYFCGSDPDRVIRLMWQSALAREKWKRPDYLRLTVANAMKMQRRSYEPRRTSARAQCSVYGHSGGG
jgi:putative DNA primase/helicase